MPITDAAGLASCAVTVEQGAAEIVNAEIKLASKNRFIGIII